MRDDLLDKKAKAIQRHLSAWAKRKEVLAPGERIVFTLRIDASASVIRDIDAVNIADINMTIEDFFSEARLMTEGRRQRMTVRGVHSARNALFREIEDLNERYERGLHKMTDFLDECDDWRWLAKTPGIGRKGIDLLSACIERANFPFRGR